MSWMSQVGMLGNKHRELHSRTGIREGHRDRRANQLIGRVISITALVLILAMYLV